MEIPLLRDLIIIFGLSIGVLLLCHHIKIPTVVGFLLTGILSGPHGLGLIKHPEEVQILAEVGVIMLLFAVGMELSIRKMFGEKRFFLLGGLLQVTLTTLVGFLVGKFLDRPLGESIFLGFLLSLSSTAIVLKVLMRREELFTPHGRIVLGILIFQDIIVVPMMLATPLLAGTSELIDHSFLYLLAKGVIVLALIFFAALKIVPKILHLVTKTHNRELFLLTIFAICFSVAWISSLVGLSLALGAFLAGLIISESDYKHQAIGDILPFRDIFTSLFFVSIGMLLDLSFVLANPFTIILLTCGIIVMKVLIVTGTGLVLGMPLRTVVLAACALAQIGEFSFVLAKEGLDLGIGSVYYNQLFLAVAIATMALTPTIIFISHAFTQNILRFSWPLKVVAGIKPVEETEQKTWEHHVVIIGYGLNGKNLTRSCEESNIPYIVLDMNPDTVLTSKDKGIPIYFGDATQDRVLKHVHLDKARVIAIVVNDPTAALHIVEHARRMNKSAYIIVRTRFVEEMKPMFALGADDVIPDEFGSSLEISTRVLCKCDIPMGSIEKLTNTLRHELIT